MWKLVKKWVSYRKKQMIKKTALKSEKYKKKEPFTVYLCYFNLFLHSMPIFLPIFTFYMAMESYGHVDYTCFIHFEKSQKMQALGHKNVILVKSPTSQSWTLPLDTFYIAKYPKIVQFSSVIPFWKAIKLLIPEFLSVL